jgi:metal transporter CNNM
MGLNLKGLGFLMRTRSAPPARSDQRNGKRSRPPTATTMATDDDSTANPSTVPHLIDEKGVDVSAASSESPSVLGHHIPETETTGGRPLITGSAPATRAPSPCGLGSSKGPTGTPTTVTQQRHGAAQSRSDSPAPSLEAVLLERKRRLTATAVATNSAGAATASSAAPSPGYSGGIVSPRPIHPMRGIAFKSSPLSIGIEQKDRVDQGDGEADSNTRRPTGSGTNEDGGSSA